MSDLEGVMLSDYLLIECISKGGVADIYRARQVREENEGQERQEEADYDVAVKVFRPGYAQREAFRSYFMTEAEKIGQFDHPNILPFLEYGEGEGLLYLVTPFVKTGMLEDLLRRVGGRFSAIQAVPIMQQLCSAVQYAHNHDVVHGNIKPTNVLVAADGRMLLTDFGIARSYDDSQQSLTRVGWGSAEYTAPEQSLGIVRRASDIYSLGVLLFRILTGFPPFMGQTPVEVLLKHVRQPAPSARSWVPNISDAVDRVLHTALQKRSEERFASVDELHTAFLTAVTVAPVASPVARAAAPRLTKALPAENPQTPVPVHATPSRAADPYTPVPPYVVFNTSSGVQPMSPVQPISPQEADAVPQEDFPQMSPVLPPSVPTRPLTRPLGPDELEPSDVIAVRKKNFLQETDNEPQRNTIFWSSDPPEWSPIGQEASEDDKTEKISHATTNVPTHAIEGAEASAGAVPLTAEAYLQSKPLVKEAAEPVPSAGSVGSEESAQVESPPVEEDAPKQRLTFGMRFKKWLPIIVVILLLLGLIGAVVSAFFFPTDKLGALNGSYHLWGVIHVYVTLS